MDYLQVLIEFVITFAVIYLIYYFFVIKKCKDNKKIAPTEVNIILSLYKIDVKKINLYQMIKVVSLVTVTVLSTIITIIYRFFNSTIILLVFGTLISVIVAFICYQIIGRHYEKKCQKIDQEKGEKDDKK
jgi:hypothetical protein